jgi:hypothetical protein
LTSIELHVLQEHALSMPPDRPLFFSALRETTWRRLTKTVRRSDKLSANGHRTPEGDDRQSPVHVSVTSSPKGGFQHGMSSQFHATSRRMP